MSYATRITEAMTSLFEDNRNPFGQFAKSFSKDVANSGLFDSSEPHNFHRFERFKGNSVYTFCFYKIFVLDQPDYIEELAAKSDEVVQALFKYLNIADVKTQTMRDSSLISRYSFMIDSYQIIIFCDYDASSDSASVKYNFAIDSLSK